jgi:GAF domain-containing protein
MDTRDAQTFELTAAERDVVEELSFMLAHAIEQACPRLTVGVIDLELHQLAAAPTLSAA